ncbi:diguanylate cyclase domain-containing protein [Ralstonia sp. UBA689]|uniref:diguanylate cyclase domain-containing protein n=1 Tax=Ralstonia sp. UBA689 TaxID=1947373 RepID=UPI0025EFE445|nr:diguanylate cyclase [Ralstonia sp. UBA689]
MRNPETHPDAPNRPITVTSAKPAGRSSLERVLRRTYLRLAIAAVSLATIVLVFVAGMALRSYAENNLTLLARSMAYTVEAAVVFNDNVAAQEAIALIAGGEDVSQVRVFDAHGKTFALWQHADNSSLARFVHGVARLGLPGAVTVPVTHNGALLGQIEVRGRGDQFAEFLLGGMGGVLACLVIILGIGTTIARNVHRDIVAPLRAVAAVAHAVRRDRAFWRRVAVTPIVELQELGNDFNALLDEFEAWQDSLREQNATLAHQASHDSLTGLPNRAVCEARLHDAIAGADRSGSMVAVLYIDSNRFKEINDTLGHDAGDAVLVAIAARLRAPLRQSDFVARLGGDEFVVMLPGIGKIDDAVRVAQMVHDEMLEPIALPAGRQVTTTVSIGIALYPLHARDVASLLRRADAAMYAAKRVGPSTSRLAED